MTHPGGATERRRRERTLAWAASLSAFAPLATGAAVAMSQSSAQVADFVRRSVDLLALVSSWWTYRRIGRAPSLTPSAQRRLERRVTLLVAIALGLSGCVTLALTLLRAGRFEPGGNVALGLSVAVLGLLFNGAFWRRYARMQRAHPDAIIDAQRRLYRSKAAVDVSVIVALATVAVAPGHPVAGAVDTAGSLAVAVYLLVASVKTARGAGLVQHAHRPPRA